MLSGEATLADCILAPKPINSPIQAFTQIISCHFSSEEQHNIIIKVYLKNTNILQNKMAMIIHYSISKLEFYQKNISQNAFVFLELHSSVKKKFSKKSYN
jgi:hypothetical protein